MLCLPEEDEEDAEDEAEADTEAVAEEDEEKGVEADGWVGERSSAYIQRVDSSSMMSSRFAFDCKRAFAATLHTISFTYYNYNNIRKK